MENIENLNKVIGKNISRYRKHFDMTQSELAEELSYTDKAVSKWERGESLPDVVVLVKICDIFGITMNELCYERNTFKTEKVAPIKRMKHFYIAMLSVGLCWLVATIAFTMLLIFAPQLSKKWLAFIYTIPVSAIVMVVLNSKWGKRVWNFVFVSLIIWGTLLSICLSINYQSLYWLYLIGIPLEILTFIWYFFKSTILQKFNNLKKYKHEKMEDK